MAKERSTRVITPVIIELQIHIAARGRSVINGTVVIDGEMRTVKHELGESARNRIIESCIRELSVSNPEA